VYGYVIGTLFHSNRTNLYVPLFSGTIPFLEFSIEIQSNNLTFQPIYTNRQEFVYHLIKDLHYGGLGYRKISQKLNSWGIKTQRGKLWFNTSVSSVLKRKRERDAMVKEVRGRCFGTKISEFKIKYYSFD